MELAPIVLFCYNRPVHLRKTVDALTANLLASESELFIFADGAKNASDHQKVSEVDSVISNISGFKRVTIEKSNMNRGLADSVIYGVAKILELYNKAIVLEDDLLTSKYFLEYMNKALDKYANNLKVGCIQGYLYPINAESISAPFFSRGSSSWGWGTWKRAWEKFQPDGRTLYNELTSNQLIHTFDFDKSYPFSVMLKRQIKGKNSSWAIRWYASLFINDLLTLYPNNSLIKNIGHDETGTHCDIDNSFDVLISDTPINFDDIPVEENLTARNEIIKFYCSLNSIRGKLRKVLNQIIIKLGFRGSIKY